jgi:hypothetical protein
MARLNEILVGRFNRAYQKAFGIKGGPPVATLAPEIMPVHEVFHGAEDRYVEGWNRAGFTANITGIAGQLAAVQLLNNSPTLIVVVEKLTFGSQVAQLIQMSHNFTNSNLASGALVGVTLDGRQTSTAQAIPSTTTSTVAAGNVFLQTQNVANVSQEIIFQEDQELVLAPSRALLILNSAVASQLLVNIIWRERFLEEGERL